MLMTRKERPLRISLRAFIVGGAVLVGSTGVCAQTAPAPELPRPSVDVPGIKREVLSRTVVPGAPWKLAIATRATYEPGARVRKHLRSRFYGHFLHCYRCLSNLQVQS